MTTIAYDSTMLAGDRLCNDGGTPVKVTKIYELCDGNVIVGCAGESQDSAAFRDWLNLGKPADKKPRVSDGFSAIVVDRETGKAYTYENKLVPVLIEDQFYAIGSGRSFALMAMTLGYSARDAVLKVAELDLFTGYGVDSVMVQKPVDDSKWTDEDVDIIIQSGATGPLIINKLKEMGRTHCGCGEELHTPPRVTSLINHDTVFCLCGERHIYSHVKGVFLK